MFNIKIENDILESIRKSYKDKHGHNSLHESEAK